MLEVSVQADIKAATKYLNAVQMKQVPFAVSKSLNQVAYNVARKALPAQADRSFSGGATAFTKRGFKYTKSSKRNLIATVFVDEAQAKYMRFQIAGGNRFPSKRTLMVPTTHSRLNKYGNMTKGTMAKMYADKGKYFIGKPKGSNAGEGVWERYGKGKRIRMVAAFRGNAQYRPLFPFAQTTRGVVFGRGDGFAALFNKNLAAALATAR